MLRRRRDRHLTRRYIFSISNFPPIIIVTTQPQKKDRVRNRCFDAT